MDWNPGTRLPPSSVAVHKFHVRLLAVRNVLHLRWDGAETPLASSAGASLSGLLPQLFFSSVLAVVKQFFFASRGLNDACGENNKCIRCCQMMWALPKTHHSPF